jgi:GntR family transcriptional repressor for pyruvate dehydrogenase complex
MGVGAAHSPSVYSRQRHAEAELNMERVEPKKLPTRVEIVLDYITGEIAKGNLGPGDKLPNEKELAASLGLSRTPMREAMKILAASGLIDIRHGYGNYIRKDNGLPALPLMMFQLYLKDSRPEQLMELRYIFDRNCTELAAERRTDEDLAAMRECIERLRKLSKEENSPLDELLKTDLDFHRAIYAATGNKLIVAVAEFVLNMVAPWVRKSLDVSGRYRAVGLHEQIYEVIEGHKTGRASRKSVDVNLRHFQASLEAVMAAASYRYLVNLPGVCQGKTIVEGTRIGVHDVVGLTINGASVEDVCRRFPDLSRAQVYECLAYYEDHRTEIDVLVAEQVREKIT